MDRDRDGGLPSVLIISFYYDLGNEVGALRPNALAAHLGTTGWRPIVITAGDPGDDVTRDDLVVRHVPAPATLRNAKRRVGAGFASDAAIWSAEPTERRRDRPWTRIGRGIVREIAGIVPDTATWPVDARKAALRAARRYRPAAVFSSAPPHSVTLVGHAVAGRLRLPWIVEFQDLWVGYPIRRGTRLRRSVDRVLESITMRRARAIVTVSDPLVDKLRRLHPELSVVALASGIDDAIVAPPDGPVDADFTILYTGRIYNGRQDLGHLLRAARAAIDSGRVDATALRIVLVLLHPLADEDRRLVDELGLAANVDVRPRVTRDEAIALQRRAQVLLHLRWDDPNEPGIMTGKIFEYLAAGRPILSTGRYADSASALVDRTRAGIATTTEADTAAWLGSAFAEYRATGRAPYDPDRAALDALGAAGMARGVAAILDEVTSAAPRSR
jgi:glycosyltransferase involved in cell wall biosynthesis